MKKQFIAAFLGLTVACTQALAYLGPNDKDYKPTVKPKANCSPATAKLTMKFNDVSALIEQGGSMSKTVQQVLLPMKFLKEVTALQSLLVHSGWVVLTSTDSLS